jgi:4,5-dihydroxyphthalate decarboxylase
MNASKGAIPITYAGGLYDRVQALYTGEVKPEGIDFRFVVNDEPREIFNRMLAGQDYDVSEMSGSDFIARLSVEKDRCPLVALPVFPSRVFRHSFMWFNARSGIRKPADLAGRRIGVPRYSMTAAVWMRGTLMHEYGVDVSGVEWVEGAIHKPGPHGDPPLTPLVRDDIRIVENDPRKSLNQALDEGSIDAFLGTAWPECRRHNPDVRRLFPDWVEDEKAYYRRTGLYPIMHIIAMRRSTSEANPTVASSLCRAFEASKQTALKHMRHLAALRYMLPWMTGELEEIDRLMDGDPFPNGIEANRKTLETLMDYMVEQGILAERMPVESLFVAC